MRLSVLSGTASHVQHASETIDTHGGEGHVRATRTCTFRIGRRPALIHLPVAPSVSEGDQVTIAGHEQAYGFVGYALRNETTGATYAFVTWPYYLGGGLLVALGIPLSTILVGIPLFAAGVWAIHVARRYAQAAELLESAPRPGSA